MAIRCEILITSYKRTHCKWGRLYSNFQISPIIHHLLIQWTSLNRTPVNQTSRLLLPCHNLVTRL